MLATANGMLISATWLSHKVSAPGAACALVTLRIVKYAANSAAKNISSEASQMIVPTATGSGTSVPAPQPGLGDRVQRARRLGHRTGDGMGVKGHGVIIAATLLQVTLGRDFVS